MKLDSNTKAAIKALKTATTEGELFEGMRAAGFSMPSHNGYSSVGLVWVGERFVIKNAFFYNKELIPKRAVPHKKLGKLCNLDGWIAQPRCEPLTKKEFKKVMAGRMFAKWEKEAFDLNECNVGKLGRKIVAFDW